MLPPNDDNSNTQQGPAASLSALVLKQLARQQQTLCRHPPAAQKWREASVQSSS